MNQLSSRIGLWRSSTGLIFWGIIALTLFGWFASISESIFGFLDIFFSMAEKYNDAVMQFGQTDSGLSNIIGYYRNTATVMRVFEILTIGGWVMYIVGLSQFRKSQISERGQWLTGNLNSACWLGLIAIFCYFIAGWLGLFGMLFRLAGWILNLISLFKFANAFSRLSREKSWDERARAGAGNLKTSYTFAIILQFFPIIFGIVILFALFGMASELPAIFNHLAM